MLGLVAPFCRDGLAGTFSLYSLWPGLVLDALVFFIIPGSLVAVGSYLDAVNRNTAGFVLILVGGIFVALMMLIHLIGGVFYVSGFWGGLVIVSQGLLAILAMVLALAVRIPTASD